MDKLTPEATINDVNRKPLAYALMILGALVSAFVGMYFFSQRHSTTTCETEIERLEQRLAQVQAEKDKLKDELLIKAGVIDRAPQVVDSLVKTKN